MSMAARTTIEVPKRCPAAFTDEQTFMGRMHAMSEDLDLHRRRRMEGNVDPLKNNDPLWACFSHAEYEREIKLQMSANWERMQEDRT